MERKKMRNDSKSIQNPFFIGICIRLFSFISYQCSLPYNPHIKSMLVPFESSLASQSSFVMNPHSPSNARSFLTFIRLWIFTPKSTRQNLINSRAINLRESSDMTEFLLLLTRDSFHVNKWFLSYQVYYPSDTVCDR